MIYEIRTEGDMRKPTAQRRKSLERLQNLFFRSSNPSTDPPLARVRDTLDPYKYTEAIIEAVHQPLVILDRNLTIRSANKAFYKTFKITRKETLGQNIVAAGNHSPQLIELAKRFTSLSDENTSFEEYEITLPFRKIGDRTLLLNAKRILLGKYATDFILVGVEDITKRKMIDKQKDDFIGYVTHELKTPITTVTAFTQILQGYHAKTGDKKSQFLLSKVATQLERLNGLVNSFAKVYKAQTGRLEIQKQKIDLDRLVHEDVEGLQYTTTTHNLIIKGSITKSVMADKERIHEVLINLIINAIKYSPNANKIIIKLSEKENEAVISVKDYGFGITREEQKKVFERFFRVQSKNDNRIEGLGLGLYLVSEIVKLHHGKIWVNSKVGKGSTFSFMLPLK
jgi:PAS domain S-box-containing protein